MENELIENLGTSGPDTLNGTENGDLLGGLAGDDILF